MVFKTASAELEERLIEIFTENKDKVFEKNELLSEALQNINRVDMTQGVVAGVLHRLKTQGFIRNVGRGKYSYNNNSDNKNNIETTETGDYLLLKSKNILDKLIIEFNDELLKIDATKIETTEDIQKMNFLKSTLGYLKEQRESLN